jgi:hypothetical protein
VPDVAPAKTGLEQSIRLERWNGRDRDCGRIVGTPVERAERGSGGKKYSKNDRGEFRNARSGIGPVGVSAFGRSSTQEAETRPNDSTETKETKE